MEYGLIFHVTRIGDNFRGIWADIPRYAKYYCKNMKYRINVQYIQLVKYKNHQFLPFCYFPLRIERK